MRREENAQNPRPKKASQQSALAICLRLKARLRRSGVPGHTSRFYGTGHGYTFQISVAYSLIVRSLENFPEPATFKMAMRAHAS